MQRLGWKESHHLDGAGVRVRVRVRVRLGLGLGLKLVPTLQAGLRTL